MAEEVVLLSAREIRVEVISQGAPTKWVSSVVRQWGLSQRRVRARGRRVERRMERPMVVRSLMLE